MATSIGERLRRAREALPASLTEASRATRVRVDFLESMERDSFSFISGRVYVVGMLRSYARWLRLDEDAIAAEFDRIYGEPEPAVIKETAARNEPRMPSVKPRQQPWAIVGAATVGILVVLLLASLLRSGHHGNAAAPISPSPSLSPSLSPLPSAGASAPAASAPAASAPAGGVAPSPGSPGASPSAPPAAPAPSAAGITVAMAGSRSSFIHVVAGSTIPSLVLFDGSLASGDTRTFTAADVLRVFFANLGAVKLTVNGKDVGAPGSSGQSGFVVINPDGTIAPDPTATASPTPKPSPSPQPTRLAPRPTPGPTSSPASSPGPVGTTSPASSPTALPLPGPSPVPFQPPASPAP